MIFIGDVHGRIPEYRSLLRRIDNAPTIQVGDMGVFDEADLAPFPPHHRFIRGNHDNPEMCARHPNYLGDYGYLEKENIFYIGGGFSVDKDIRIAWEKNGARKSWWESEEIPDGDFRLLTALYEKIKPEIVVSHECPASISSLVSPGPLYVVGTGWVMYGPSRTANNLQNMLDRHRPRLWVFGHHHCNFLKEEQGTKFVCVAPLSTWEDRQSSVATAEVTDTP